MLKGKLYRSPAGEGGGGTSPAGGQGDNPSAGDTSNGTSPAGSQQESPVVGDTNTPKLPDEQDIKDPIAFYKTQSDTLQRLLDQARSQLTDAQKRLQTVGSETEASVKADYEKLQTELQSALTETQKAQREANRYKVIAATGLPEALANRLTGDTYDEMLADAKSLAEIIPAGGSGGATSAGRDGAPASTGQLTIDMIRNMSTGEIRARQDEVDAVLAAQK